jgi:hypothetical protein
VYKQKIKNIQDMIIVSLGSLDNNSQKFKYKFIISLICRDWPDIIGDPLCRFTRPAYIYDNILHVACVHGGIIQTLNFQSSEIYQRIQMYDYHCNIKGIKFIPESKTHKS